MEDVVYLKNGEIVRDTIIEQIPGESLEIQTQDGSVSVYSVDEITKIVKEPATGAEEAGANIEIGMLFGYPIFLSMATMRPLSLGCQVRCDLHTLGTLRFTFRGFRLKSCPSGRNSVLEGSRLDITPKLPFILAAEVVCSLHIIASTFLPSSSHRLERGESQLHSDHCA